MELAIDEAHRHQEEQQRHPQHLRNDDVHSHVPPQQRDACASPSVAAIISPAKMNSITAFRFRRMELRIRGAM